MVKSIAKVVSILTIVVGFATSLQKLREGLDPQQAVSYAVMAVIASITMNVMLN